MEIIDIKIDNNMRSEPYPTLLSKGIRSECLYFNTAVIVTIKPKKWIDCFYRLFWEDNYLHIPRTRHSKFVRHESKDIFDLFEMHLTLAEVMDFLYDATPPLLRNQLPSGTQTIDDIVELMKTFLIEESKQRDMYQSIFQKITKYGVFEKRNVMDLQKMQLLRQKTPTGLLCQVIYSTSALQTMFDTNVTVNGIFLLHANNNTDMEEFVRTMFKYYGQHSVTVCDVHRDPSSGNYIMIQYIGDMFNELVTRTYKPFVSV